MERFLEQFFETLYDKESFKNDRIGIIQNDGKRSYIPISPGKYKKYEVASYRL
jgi:hypothetical protein